jgi:hypothetical protein
MDNIKLKMSDITIINKNPIQAVDVRAFDGIHGLDKKSITCEYIISYICSLFPCKIVYSIDHN